MDKILPLEDEGKFKATHTKKQNRCHDVMFCHGIVTQFSCSVINYPIHDFSCASFSCDRLDIFSVLAMLRMININHHGMIQPLYIITTVTSPTLKESRRKTEFTKNRV